ncbi:hypothetical protein SAMN05421827_11126 [Pedobacter terrae]|uniref:Uncharacterized protein n=1 Tax=Pedobacter terrae TaxID=405671 RepID=A0A1G7X1T4_9SPHI|nr:hypothetical protein SAMN05421827_11126 [Pedobacter terrae]
MSKFRMIEFLLIKRASEYIPTGKRLNYTFGFDLP